MAHATPSQTIGPYWHLLLEPSWADLTRFGATGEVITLEGQITDGAGALVTDACVEIWQTSPPISETFDGFGRSRTDMNGMFHFKTIRPGPTPGLGNAQQAPHLALTILARGITKALMTRVYFEGDDGQDTDPVLNLIEDPKRRATLIAKKTSEGSYRTDICLQGPAETVFLDV